MAPLNQRYKALDMDLGHHQGVMPAHRISTVSDEQTRPLLLRFVGRLRRQSCRRHGSPLAICRGLRKRKRSWGKKGGMQADI
jgi:hypothetical protein